VTTTATVVVVVNLNYIEDTIVGFQFKPELRKQPADSVPYGSQIATRGNSVWCAYTPDGGELVCVDATADAARRKYDLIMRRRNSAEHEARKLAAQG
jgi:hypothetical protein